MAGSEIKRARWKLEMTQQELAKKCRLHRSTIIDAEHDRKVGDRAMYLIENAIKEMM